MHATGSRVQQFLLHALVPIVSSVGLGFVFYQDGVFNQQHGSFQFVWSSVVASIFYYLLVFLRPRSIPWTIRPAASDICDNTLDPCGIYPSRHILRGGDWSQRSHLFQSFQTTRTHQYCLPGNHVSGPLCNHIHHCFRSSSRNTPNSCYGGYGR